jgi:hypothetical protein
MLKTVIHRDKSTMDIQTRGDEGRARGQRQRVRSTGAGDQDAGFATYLSQTTPNRGPHRCDRGSQRGHRG